MKLDLKLSLSAPLLLSTAPHNPPQILLKPLRRDSNCHFGRSQRIASATLISGGRIADLVGAHDNIRGFPDSSVGKESHMQCRRPWFNSWVGKICWRRDRLPTPVFLGLPCSSAGKEPACTAGDLGSILQLGRSPGEGKGYPLQYSGLENSMDCSPWGSDMTEPLSLSRDNINF